MGYTYYVCGIPYSDELYHHGIKGQKWGIRRFQNKDGTRTAAGKKRYNYSESDGKEKQANNHDKLKKVAKGVAIAAGTAALAYGAYKLSKSDVGKEFIESHRKNASMLKDVKNMHKMSDEDLLEKLGRLKTEKDFMETTYSLLSSSANPTTRIMKDAGRKVATAALAGVGSYSMYALLNGKADKKQLANYAFSNPNKKK